MKSNKVSKLRMIAYTFFVIQILVYVIYPERFISIISELNSYNEEISEVSNTGFKIGLFIGATFLFWIGLGFLYLDQKRKKSE